MIYSALLLAATAAIASAQVTYDPASGQFICPADNPNGAFCAGDSLSTNIIIRCNNGVGQPGNCNDNLAGFFPYGVQSSPCWQSSPTSGIAACSKNCIVQGGSGTYKGTFVLPNCTPVPNPSSTSSTAQPTTTSTTITSTGTTTYASAGTTITKTFTTTYCPPITTPAPGPPSNSTQYPPGTLSTKTNVQPSGTGSTGNPSGNGTAPTAPGGSATATPVGPSASGTGGPILSNNAMTNSAGAGLAAVGLFIAYFL